MSEAVDIVAMDLHVVIAIRDFVGTTTARVW